MTFAALDQFCVFQNDLEELPRRYLIASSGIHGELEATHAGSLHQAISSNLARSRLAI